MPRDIPPPAQVRFVSLYEPDTATLADSLVPFGRWSERSISELLPVAVSYPSEISQRLAVLKGYLTAGGWPAQVHTDAISTVRYLVEKMMSDIEAEITQAVRLMAAAARRDDGSCAVAERDQVLASFLASKMLATARMLRDYQLIGEPPLDWGAEFYDMGPVRSDRLIYGLSFVGRDPHGWAGWTDADLHIGGARYRIFVPICPKPEDPVRLMTLVPEDFRRLIVPQLLCSNLNDKLPLFMLRKLVLGTWGTLERDLVLREEYFVDGETYSDHPHAKDYVTRIAADRIISFLHGLPKEERAKEFFRIEFSFDSLSHEVAERVWKELPSD